MKLILKFIPALFLVSCTEHEKPAPSSPQVVARRVEGSDTLLTLKYYYPSGKIKCVSDITTRGEKHGVEDFYFENGIQKYQYYFISGGTLWAIGKGHTITGDSLYLGNLAFGQGEFRICSDSGKILTRGFYKDSRQDSIWSFYYADGKPERTVGWKNGLQHGKSERYFENGKIEQDILWEYGYMVHSKHYFKSGRVFREINYKNGLEDGKATEYYDEDGRIRQIRTYRDGKENGYVYQYNADGSLREKAKMQNGEFIDTLFIYNAKGEVIKTTIVRQKRSGNRTTTI